MPIFEKRNCHHADSEAEVDFSLTLNHSAMEAPPSPPHAHKYEDLQQQLTDEVHKQRNIAAAPQLHLGQNFVGDN